MKSKLPVLRVHRYRTLKASERMRLRAYAAEHDLFLEFRDISKPGYPYTEEARLRAETHDAQQALQDLTFPESADTKSFEVQL